MSSEQHIDSQVARLIEMGQKSDALDLFATPAYMRQRKTGPIGYHLYLDDLHRAQQMLETGSLDDLPQRILLSYLEGRVRAEYADIPDELFDLWLVLSEDSAGTVSALAQMRPRPLGRVYGLINIGIRLEELGQRDKAQAVMKRAMPIYYSMDDADFLDADSTRSRVARHMIVEMARTGIIDHALLEELRQFRTRTDSGDLRDEFRPSAVGFHEMCYDMCKNLGYAGVPNEDVGCVLEEIKRIWPPDDDKEFDTLAEKSFELYVDGLIRAGHWKPASNALLQMDTKADGVCKMWARYFESGVGTSGSAQVRETWEILDQKVRDSISAHFDGSWWQAKLEGKGPLADADAARRPQIRAWRNWHLTYVRALLWQQRFDVAYWCLALYGEANASGSLSFLERNAAEFAAFERVNRYRMSGLSFLGDYGSFRHLGLWLAVLGQFDLLHMVASTDKMPPFFISMVQDKGDFDTTSAKVYPLLADLNSLEHWPQWSLEAEKSTRSNKSGQIGLSYVALKLALQGHFSEAEQVAKQSESEAVYVALAQGMTLHGDVTGAQEVLRENARHEFSSGDTHFDFGNPDGTIAFAYAMMGQPERASSILREARHTGWNSEGPWLALSGPLSYSAQPAEFVTELEELDIERAVRIISRLVPVDVAYAYDAVKALLQKRVAEPNWGRGLDRGWPDQSVPAADVDLAELEKRVGRKLDLQVVRRAFHALTQLFDLRELVIGGILLIRLPHELWVGAERLTYSGADWPPDALEAVIDFALLLRETARTPDEMRVASVGIVLGMCLRMPYQCEEQFARLTESMQGMRGLASQIPLAWAVGPMTLASFGQIDAASRFLERIVQDWSQLKDASAETGWDDPMTRDSLMSYALAQMCLVAPTEEQRIELLKQWISLYDDVNILLQMLVFHVQHENETAAQIALGAVLQLAAVARADATEAKDDDWAAIPDNGLDPYNPRLVYSPIPSLDAEQNDRCPDPWSDREFLGSMLIELAKSQRTDIALEILDALGTANDDFNEIRQVIELSPSSLAGMLAAAEMVNLRRKALVAEEWPHNVLFSEAAKISSVSGFLELSNAIVTTVDFDDIWECYQAVMERMPAEFVIEFLEDLSSSGDGFNSWERALFTVALVQAAVRHKLVAADGQEVAKAVAAISGALEEFQQTTDTLYRVFVWNPRSPESPYWRSDKLSPLASYSYGMAAFYQLLAKLGLPEERDWAFDNAMEGLYRELSKTECWDQYDFQRGLRLILKELGGTALVEDVAMLLHDVGTAWSDSARESD